MFLRNNTPYVERSDLISAHVEALCPEIRKPKSKPILVSTSYRPPDSNIMFLQCLEKFGKRMTKAKK